MAVIDDGGASSGWPFELSANRLAKAIGVTINRITEIVNGTRGITG